MGTDTALLGLKNLISFAKARIKMWRQDPLFWGPVLVGAIVYVVLVFSIFARNDLLLWATQKTAAIFIIGFIWMVLWIYRYAIADVIAAAGTRMYNTALTVVKVIFPRIQLPMTKPPYRYTRFVVAIVFLIIGVLLGVWFTSGEGFEEVLASVPQEGKFIFIVFFIWLTLWLNMYFVVAAGARIYKIALAAVQQIFPRFPPSLAKSPNKDIFIVVSTVFLIVGIWLYIWENFFGEVFPTEHTIPLYSLRMFLTGLVFFLTEGEDLLLDTHIVVLFGGVTVCAFLICIANLGPYDPCPECESWFTRKEVKSKREYVPGSYFKNAKTVRHYECSKCGANRGSSNYPNPFFDLIDPDRSIKQRFISIFWILFFIFGMSAVLWTAYHT